MYGRIVAVSLLVLVIAGRIGYADPDSYEPPSRSYLLSIVPEAAIPLGSSRDYFQFGGGGSLSGHFGLRSLSWLSLTIETGYSLLPLEADATLSVIRLAGGAHSVWALGERLSVAGFASAGGFFGVLSGDGDGTGYGPALRGGVGVSVTLTETLDLLGGAAYKGYPGLYNGVSAFVGTSFRLGAAGSSGSARRTGRSQPATPRPTPLEEQDNNQTDWTAVGELQVGTVELERMFPVLFKYYDEYPLGSVTVRNSGAQPIRNLEVRFNAERIVDNPKLSAKISALPPGESKTVDLYALFNDQVLTYTEGTRLAAAIEFDYQVDGKEHNDSMTVTLSTYDRNALRWDHDEKVAAFVTAKDPEIQRIAKNMAALSRREGAQAVSTELQLAMAQFALMQARGLAYVVDPSSAYSELSANPLAVDYVQFPRQTLQYQAGDCDDLSATYAALLQSVGVDTAFVTIPGHIYTAFRLEMSRREARTSFANIDDLIFRDDGTVWIPVETTLLEKSFMEAWAEGARQWREHNPDGNAGFYPTTDAWQTYEPVAFSVSDTAVPTPEQETVAALFTRELNRFVNRQIHSREQRLLARLEERPEDPRLLNRLGVLYARYGKTEEARKRFEAIVEHEPFAPAWVNLANIAFLNGEYREAGHYYTRALEENPYSEAALVGRARVAHRLENYEEAEERYEVLARLAPEVAERFSYLDPARADAQTRAGAAAQLSREVVWEEMEL